MVVVVVGTSLLVATLKVRLGKRQRQNSIQPLNLEDLKEEKAVQFAAEVTNRFTALICLQCFDAVGWAAGRASGL